MSKSAKKCVCNILFIDGVVCHREISVPEDELIHKVYNAEKNNPVKGDRVLKVGEDMEKLGLNIEENEIKSKTTAEYKEIVEEKIAESALYTI